MASRAKCFLITWGDKLGILCEGNSATNKILGKESSGTKVGGSKSGQISFKRYRKFFQHKTKKKKLSNVS